jgi:MSHA biogenesis protein MshE
MTRKRVRLGDLLREKKLISEEQLREALQEQRTTGRKLGRVLIDIGAVSEIELHNCLAEYLDIPFVDLAHMSLDPRVVGLLPETHARRYRALVLREDGAGLLVGMADPTDLFAFDELSRLLQKPIRLALAKEAALLRTIDIVYRRTDEIVSLAEELDEELSQADVNVDMLSAEEGSPDAPVIKLIQSMFYDAVRVSASDIHIEPEEGLLRVRLRVDGMLQEQIIDGHRVGQALVTRLKLMCGLDIAEKRRPQDGRFSIKVADKALDVRVATMPIYGGEAIVLRLLDQAAGHLSFEQLGMPERMVARFKELVDRTAGMVLVTGPTGSGKTTTLYAALNHVNLPSRKIITAEDPVEYRLERVNQVQVNPKIGLDFAAVLRTALRQDPDIVLVGEMRDRETVEMGLRAAMTGHLVFSTLHTINAATSVNRLLDMGAEGFLIASALHCILAQRLMRRLCESCAEPVELTPQQAAWLKRETRGRLGEDHVFHHGTGCTYCNTTGYRGRIGIYELLEIDGPLADAIRIGDVGRFARLAQRQAGFVPLVEQAIDYAAAQITSIEEVIRVTAGLEEREPAGTLVEDVLDSRELVHGSI